MTTIELQHNEGNLLRLSFDDFDRRAEFIEDFVLWVEKAGRIKIIEPNTEQSFYSVEIHDFNLVRFDDWEERIRKATATYAFSCVACYLPYIGAVENAVSYDFDEGVKESESRLSFQFI
jgi:hypothetical protein